jgi:hypothetical protein
MMPGHPHHHPQKGLTTMNDLIQTTPPMPVVPFEDMQQMAVAIAKSGLFGMKNPDQALALMLISQAEGRHPALAARDYHIIQGKATLKADTMLARFQEAGGKVDWNKYNANEVSGTFSHPQGGSMEFGWTIDDAKNAGLTGKDVWKQYPRSMLRARTISEGIRTIYPAVLNGMYTPEEVIDFDTGPIDTNKLDKAQPVDAVVVDTPLKKDTPKKDTKKKAVEKKAVEKKAVEKKDLEPMQDDGPATEDQKNEIFALIDTKAVPETLVQATMSEITNASPDNPFTSARANAAIHYFGGLSDRDVMTDEAADQTAIDLLDSLPN